MAVLIYLSLNLLISIVCELFFSMKQYGHIMGKCCEDKEKLLFGLSTKITSHITLIDMMRRCTKF